jgi:acyl transferase domain-containing protein
MVFLSKADFFATQEEPIAVIGLSCRLPGADGPDKFWNLLREGRSAVGPVPGSRWSEDQFPGGTDPSSPGSLGARYGGFIDGVDLFDAAFFGISPREAVEMDPQQRIALELGWEALEDAGIVPADLQGERAGVFVGAMWDDYATLTFAGGESRVGHHTAAGVHRGMIANRLSYFLRINGPSLTVDTGQSSSLVAVHVASESLRSGEATLAIVGGVNLNLAPQSTIALEQMGSLSPDGRCYTFDARANGFVRGEGGAFVVLKPLSKAMADGDHVYCVIRGTALNNDGGGAGLLSPNPAAQQAVLRAAYRRAGIDPREVQYVELHGTGTRVGDPIEASALGSVLGAGRQPHRPLLVGSAKTNVGHLEGAAGIVGLVKAALAVRHGMIPPSLNFEQPSPDIDFAGWRLSVADRLQPWPCHDERDQRSDTYPGGEEVLAGVSSFGMGGTNCHVVVSGAPRAQDVEAGGPDEVREGDRGGNQAFPAGHAVSVVPWVVSGRSGRAVRAQAARLAQFLQERPGLGAAEVGHALATSRSALEYRAVVVGADRGDLMAGLAALAEGTGDARVVTGQARGAGKTAFLFAGQGSQRVGMGQQLYARFPVFAAAWDQICALTDPLLPRPLGEVAFARPDAAAAAALERTEFAQPVLFAFEVALYRLLQSWGVRADAVAGHSVGEIAAAHVAGVLSLEDACRMVTARGRLMQGLPAGGTMAAVRAAEADVTALLEEHGQWRGRVAVAAVNGPAAVVVAGEEAAVGEVQAVFARRGTETRRLRVSHAFHSPLMEPALEDLRRVAEGLSYRAPDITAVSTVTGQPVGPQEWSQARYWVAQARGTVRFADAVRELSAQGVTRFVEIGPDGVLSALVSEILPEGHETAVVATVRRDRDEAAGVIAALASLHVHGASPDWDAFFPAAPWHPAAGTQRVELPTYAFQRERYWLRAADRPGDAGALGQAPVVVDPRDGGTREDAHIPGARERLAALSEPERRRVLTDIVTTQTQIVLGHSDRTAIDPRRTLRDMGVDSLVGLELRNRLAAETGLELPATLIFDHPTIDQIAGMLDAELGGASDAAPPDADGESWTDDAAVDLVAHLFRQSLEAGELELGNSLLMSVARLRPMFEDSADVERIPQPVSLVDPGAGARLVFFNPATPLNGNLGLAVLSQNLPAQLRVSALVSPGFESGEKIPATGAALISMHADTITDFVGDTPFLLGGHSSGGVIAHEVAKELIARGVMPSGLILVDTYTYGRLAALGLEAGLLSVMFARASEMQIPIDGYKLSATQWISGLFRDWEPAPLPIPSLLIRATQPFDAGLDDWQTTLDYMSSTVDVPGNHLNLTYVETTAQAIARWLEEHVKLPDA